MTKELAPGRAYTIDDLNTVATFLRWAEVDRAYYAGHHANKAFDALARIAGVPADEFRRVIHVDSEED